MTLNIHLHFHGNCKQAFEFYEKCLGAKISFLMTFGQAPGHEQMPPEMKDQVMHVSMPVGSTLLMGADSPHPVDKPAGISVSFDTTDAAEAERVYAALSEGGEVTMPLQETFWAQRFGMLHDKFGVPWMINCGKPQ